MAAYPFRPVIDQASPAVTVRDTARGAARWVVLLLLGGLLSGCGSGAVVFAPTPAPPDASPLRFDHPAGAFSIEVPRVWSSYVQNTTALASAAFSAPGADEPLLSVAVINLGERLDSNALATVMDLYQRALRPDAATYAETARAAMGDGSWRLSGVQQRAGLAEPRNTFIQAVGPLLAVIEAQVPDDAAERATLERAINTLVINPDAPLEVAQPAALASSATSDLHVQHLAAWTTPQGVFFITGEVVNRGAVPLAGVPIRAVLNNADGRAIAEARDVVMGHAIPPGGFAPFSLRFGQGQPPGAFTYDLIFGGADWSPPQTPLIYGAESLAVTSDSRLEGDGRLIISGTVRNQGADRVQQVRVVATVFDARQGVIGAAFIDLPVSLAPGNETPYQLVVQETGGIPMNFSVAAQALP